MNLLRSPRNKIVAISVVLTLLSLGAVAKGLDAVSIARWVLAAAAVAGLLYWHWKARPAGGRFALPARLQVVSRAGLAQRCGVALVEADGRTFLVVHGDGYAEVCEAPSGPRAQGRRPPRRPRPARVVKGGAR
jgi:hypothetical protein